jgi:hypothetical protein
MQQLKSHYFLLLTCILFTSTVFSQSNPITTAVPFLMIAPDARSGSMGDAGVSTSPDVFSIYWNPAKYAFAEKDFGVGIGYVPWLRGLVNDIGLASIAGFKKFGDKQAVAMSLRYFSMGTVNFTDENGNPTIDVKPNEFAIDATYSRKFSPSFAGAVAGRFIYSNLVPANYLENARPGMSVAADISLYYHKELSIKGLTGSWISFGLDISNIGSKISYSSVSINSNFIPTNLRLGPSFTMDLDEYNRITIAIDFNKLLVPTPPIYATDSLGHPILGEIAKGKDPNVSPITGMLQSFYDAPGGFQEELQEITISPAIEYWYNKLFAIRAGYFYENKNKGDRQFFTIGAGLRYNVFGLDFSYLVPVRQNNPLQNTMQFTLLFNFDKAGSKDKQQSTQ